MFLLLLFGAVISDPYFFEPFEEDTIGSRWIISEDPFYNGTWAIQNRINDPVEEGSKGLTAISQTSFHGISTAAEFDADGDEFVIQYEVKIQEPPVDCGGAYLKLISEEFLPSKFNDSTKFAIMFGPDKCGSKNKVQYIHRTQNLKSKYWDQHRLEDAPLGRWDNLTHLYRLVLSAPDNFEIYVDGELEQSGSLLDENMIDPPHRPPKMIPDYKDLKPLDWVDEKEIPDANDTKPEDWDDDAPMEIRDPNATKPEDWQEETPTLIPDPNATKPAEWNDEEDGAYEIPMIENPECETHGCGKWEAPLIKNPNYRGKWKPRMIPNPAYKGEWKPREVENPYYFEPENIHKIGHIYGVGFDILVLNPNVLFDNIYIGPSHAEAMELANSTWVPRHKAELKQKAREEKQMRKEQRANALAQMEGADIKTKFAILKDVALDWAEDEKAIAALSVLVLLALITTAIIFSARRCVKAPVESSAAEGAQDESPEMKDEVPRPTTVQREAKDEKEEAKDVDGKAPSPSPVTEAVQSSIVSEEQTTPAKKRTQTRRSTVSRSPSVETKKRAKRDQ